jgi:hypothetical protein
MNVHTDPFSFTFIFFNISYNSFRIVTVEFAMRNTKDNNIKLGLGLFWICYTLFGSLFYWLVTFCLHKWILTWNSRGMFVAVLTYAPCYWGTEIEGGMKLQLYTLLPGRVPYICCWTARCVTSSSSMDLLQNRKSCCQCHATKPHILRASVP